MTDLKLKFLTPDRLYLPNGSTVDTEDLTIRRSFGTDKKTLIPNYLKACCRFANTDSYIVCTDTHSLKQFFDSTSNSVARRFHYSLKKLAPTEKSRVYRYEPNFIPSGQATKSNLYNLTKLYEFIVNPPDFFRTPFSIGGNSVSGHKIFIHPGNYRLMSTMFLQDPIPCTLFFKTNDVVLHSILPFSFERTMTILQAPYKLLEKAINLDTIQPQADIRYSHITGIQIVEHHPILPEYKKEYKIEWTGTQFIVNDIIVATLKNGIFVPLEPAR